MKLPGFCLCSSNWGENKYIDKQEPQKAEESRQVLDLYDENKPSLIQSS